MSAFNSEECMIQIGARTEKNMHKGPGTRRNHVFSALALFLLAAIPVFLPFSGLKAQISCTGTGCALLPLEQTNLNSMLTELQNQYTDELFDDMAEAAVVSSLAGAPMGTVNLQGFTGGVNLAVGMLSPREVSVSIPGYGTLDNMPVAGAAINPRVFFGMNLGQLVGQSYDPFSDDDEPSYFSLARFDVYINLIDVHQTLEGGGSTGGKTSAAIYQRGLDIRYHLVEGGNIIAGPLLRFLGVSVGVGMNTMRQSVEFTMQEADLDTTLSGQQLIWEGSNIVSWETKLDTYTLEVRSGIQLLYLFNLTLGVGLAMNKGNSDFTMNRTGPIYLKTNLPASLGFETPTAVLGVNLAGTGEVPARLGYGKVGLEFNLVYLKLALEGVFTKRAQGANVAIRFEL